jgi:hypothetical protein
MIALPRDRQEGWAKQQQVSTLMDRAIPTIHSAGGTSFKRRSSEAGLEEKD